MSNISDPTNRLVFPQYKQQSLSKVNVSRKVMLSKTSVCAWEIGGDLFAKLGCFRVGGKFEVEEEGV